MGLKYDDLREFLFITHAVGELTLPSQFLRNERMSKRYIIMLTSLD